jgi:hypothetical protein
MNQTDSRVIAAATISQAASDSLLTAALKAVRESKFEASIAVVPRGLSLMQPEPCDASRARTERQP